MEEGKFMKKFGKNLKRNKLESNYLCSCGITAVNFVYIILTSFYCMMFFYSF